MKPAFIRAPDLLKYYIMEHSGDNKTALFALVAITESKLRVAWKTTAASGPSKLIDSSMSSFPRIKCVVLARMMESSICEVQWKEMCATGLEKKKKKKREDICTEAQRWGDKSKGEVCAWMDYGYGMCECVCVCVCVTVDFHMQRSNPCSQAIMLIYRAVYYRWRTPFTTKTQIFALNLSSCVRECFAYQGKIVQHGGFRGQYDKYE